MYGVFLNFSTPVTLGSFGGSLKMAVNMKTAGLQAD